MKKGIPQDKDSINKYMQIHLKVQMKQSNLYKNNFKTDSRNRNINAPVTINET